MKKLLLTAFICMLGMVSSVRAASAPSCSDLNMDIEVMLNDVPDEAKRQLLLNTWRAEIQKSPEAELLMGMAAFCGVGFPKDVSKGIRIMEDGVRRGKPNASLGLYLIYAGLVSDDTSQKDEIKAKRYLIELANSSSPELQFLIGQGYYSGDAQLGLPKNRSKAEQLWIRAASQGWVEAYPALGYFYMETQNYEAARKWFELG